MSEQRDRDDCEHGPSARECDCNAIELQAEIERLRSSLHAAVSEAGELAVKIARLRAEREKQTEYTIQLQRLIEAACHGYELPYPQLHHSQMLARLRAERDALAADAARYRYLTEDLPLPQRAHRNELLMRMAVMSYSAVSADIDAALAEGSP